MRETLVDITGGRGSHVCVPLQGSGTFVVEAMLGSFVPRDGKVLILINGAYGKRLAKICQVLGRDAVAQETPEDVPNDPEALERALAGDPEITHVAAVHCETTSGILNPIEEIARVTARHGRGLLIDAMSAFGAVPLDAREVPFDAVVASSNKCLEATPGMGFCIARSEALAKTEGNSHSLSLDLHDQYVSMEKNGQWRFTPPVQTILTFDQALKEFAAEGGVEGRGGRYRPGGRHAPARLPDPAAGRASGADHRHLPHAGRPALPVRGLLRRPARARLHHLSRQAHRGGVLPHRLHRPPGGQRNARRAGRRRRPALRDGSGELRPRGRLKGSNLGEIGS
jgi:2-aminoethylphosphonate aminotransferase